MKHAATSAASGARGDYVVALPRVTDCIGQSLRGAFRRCRLPDDMAHMLDRLDRADD